MTLDEIKQLKLQAKELKKVTGNKLILCLNEIAKTKGFKDWQLLVMGTIGTGYVHKANLKRKAESRAKWLAEHPL